ncbi:hypothetical protein F2Z80_06195 [Vibrio fortis]|uniref:Uncharacterized protein n=1 Tax=Vibrio fortis TaxID=212667 RepID=A0A5N3QY54_9VIBR|nr:MULTISPECIES: hypothetical protein [Vibrio]KAB0287136.1 hypothetical protein F2P58_21160 [Vibrio fortis]KAB0303570.1 hypothetical protein F2Z80_06195 [Vibrio fortis]QFT09948.1 hypothetical protein FIV04_08190 [Vibrio sp. THAF190c]
MKYCPFCSTELIERHHVQVCPRNEIGECRFDGYEQYEQRVLAELSSDNLDVNSNVYSRIPER